MQQRKVGMLNCGTPFKHTMHVLASVMRKCYKTVWQAVVYMHFSCKTVVWFGMVPDWCKGKAAYMHKGDVVYRMVAMRTSLHC